MNLTDVYDKAKDIPGWCHLGEANILYQYAQRVPDKGVIVELGSYHGRSATIFMLSAPWAQFTTIDHYQDPVMLNGIAPGYTQMPQLLLETLDSLEQSYTYENMDTTQAADLFEDDTVDLLYIDADHSLEGASRDIKAWLPKVKVGGRVLCHDYTPEGYFVGVVQAVRELLPEGHVEAAEMWGWEKK